MVEIIYKDIQENSEYEDVITKVLEKCYEIEGLENSKLLQHPSRDAAPR